MQAGKLREQITICRETEGEANEFGEATRTERTVAHAQASVIPLRAREQVEHDRVQTSTTYTVRMRHRVDVDSRCYLRRANGDRLDIESVIDVAERHRELEIVAVRHEEGRP